MTLIEELEKFIKGAYKGHIPDKPWDNGYKSCLGSIEEIISRAKAGEQVLPCDTWLQGIREERKRQDAKWGEQNHDIADYYTILGEELGEVGKAICETKLQGKDKTGEIFAELVQTAAVCVAMLECLTRNGVLLSSHPHKEPEQEVGLKDCPMCGSKADMLYSGQYHPTCTGDKKVYCLLHMGSVPENGFKYKEDAVTVWNRRAVHVGDRK